MYTFKNYAYIALLLLLPVLVSGQKKDWQTELQQSGSDFLQFTDQFRKTVNNQKNGIQLKSNSGSVKIKGESDFIRFRRWEYLMSSELTPEGTLPSDGMIRKAYQDYEDLNKNTIQLKSSNSTWRNISRTSNSGGYWGMGRAVDIAFHPTNSNIFWVSAETGGIWKTTNGGQSYTAQGDQLPFLGSGSIAVDPNNPNIVYTATGNNLGGYGMGIYKSTNGGNSWSATGYTTRLDENVRYNELLVHANNSSILTIATSRGIFRSTNGGTSWTRIISGNATDVTFRVNSTSTLYAVVNSKLYRSTNSGASFSEVPGAPKLARNGKISVTKANTNKLVLWSGSEIYTSTNSGSSWSKLSRISKDGGGQLGHWSLVISPTNANTLYVGEVDIYKSTNNGSSWTRITAWAGHVTTPNAPEVHADHRMLTYNPSNNLIYSCNDGGIDRYTESSRSWSRLSNGLVIPQYYSAASSEQNGDFIVAGSQDNGGAVRRKNRSWGNTNGGDAGTQAVDPTDDRYCYSNYNPSPAIIKNTNGWSNRSQTDIKPSEATSSWWQLPFTLQPDRPSTIVAGYHAVFRSTNRGSSWSKISPNFTEKNYWRVIRAIAVAPNNGNVIYAYVPRYYNNSTKRYVSARLYYTYNAKDWDSIEFAHNITGITVDPKNSRTVYVSCGDYSAGNKVFKSTNGGKTFTNISAGIPNIPAHDVEIQKDSNEVLYVATNFGVFYKDASMSSFKIYGNGLPRTRINDLHINYNKKKLRAATYGRGVYEIDMQGSTSNPPTLCEAPSNIETTAIGENSLSLNWNDIKGAKQFYTFHKKSGVDEEWTRTSIDPIKSEVVVSNLQENTSYDIDIWVQCSNDEYKSTRFTATTSSKQETCEAPANVRVSSKNTTSINLQWNALEGAKSYYMYHKRSAINENWQFTEISNLQPRGSITGLLANTDYTIDVWLQCANNEYKSTRIQVKTDAAANASIVSGGIYEISSVNPGGKLLEVNGAAKRNGANIIIWDTYQSDSNQWIVYQGNGGYYRLVPKHDQSRSLDVYRGGSANGTNVQSWQSHNGNPQQWQLINLEKNIFRIKPKVAPNKSLDINGNNNSNGTNVQIWQDNNTTAQRWAFKLVGTAGKDYNFSENTSTTTAYPNPVNEGFTVSFDQNALSTSKITLKMTDMLGKTVLNLQKEVSALQNQGALQINTTSFISGIYILSIKDDSGNLIFQDKLTIKR